MRPPTARPLARHQAIGDLPQAVVERSEPDGTGDHLVVLVHDVDDLLPLVGVERAVTGQQRLVGAANRHPDAGEQPGEEGLLLVEEHTAQPYSPGPRVDLVVHEVDGPPVWVALLVGQPQGYGVP